jgi:hypothetical protein
MLEPKARLLLNAFGGIMTSLEEKGLYFPDGWNMPTDALTPIHNKPKNRAIDIFVLRTCDHSREFVLRLNCDPHFKFSFTINGFKDCDGPRVKEFPLKISSDESEVVPGFGSAIGNMLLMFAEVCKSGKDELPQEWFE